MTKELHRFRILLLTQRNQMSREEACKHLEVSDRTLSQLLTLWEHFLPQVVTLVDKLLDQKNTKRDQTKLKFALADAVGITYRQVNRLLNASKIVVPEPKSVEKRKNRREIARNRRKDQEKWALDVIFGHSDVANAAERAELSQRQMYRLCNKLSHAAGIPYRELARLTRQQREKVAREVGVQLGL